jgi:hypothetical protein
VLRVVLEARAECTDHFRARFAEGFELGIIDAIDVLTQMIGDLRQLAFNVFTMYPGDRKRFRCQFSSDNLIRRQFFTMGPIPFDETG